LPSPTWSLLERGIWSIADQGLFSAANLLVSVGVARAVGEGEYGAFGFAYSLLSLAITVHSSLITEPMLALGSGRWSRELPAYLGVLNVAQWLLSALLALAAGLLGLVLVLAGSPRLGAASLWMALSIPGVLGLWTVRRVCYIDLEPRRAALAAAFYLVVVVVAGLGVLAAGGMGVPAAFLLLGVGALVPTFWAARALRLGWVWGSRPELWRAVLRDHWRMGTWTLGSAVFKWVPRGALFVILPWFARVEEGAALLATMNLMAPALQANVGLSTFFIPAYNRWSAGRSPRAFLRRALLMVAAPSLAWWAVIALARHPVIGFLYPGRYAGDADLVVLLGVLPLLTGVVTVQGAILFARERVRAQFWAFAAGALVTVALGAVLSSVRGARGAGAAAIASYCVIAAVMAVQLLQAPARAPARAELE
jgi:O-antigen/teichoic acid export membrane protein